MYYTNIILERLDRFLANPAWLQFYPKATIHHLPRTYSDHCPLILNTNLSPHITSIKPFII